MFVKNKSFLSIVLHWYMFLKKISLCQMYVAESFNHPQYHLTSNVTVATTIIVYWRFLQKGIGQGNSMRVY